MGESSPMSTNIRPSETPAARWCVLRNCQSGQTNTKRNSFWCLTRMVDASFDMWALRPQKICWLLQVDRHNTERHSSWVFCFLLHKVEAVCCSFEEFPMSGPCWMGDAAAIRDSYTQPLLSFEEIHWPRLEEMAQLRLLGRSKELLLQRYCLDLLWRCSFGQTGLQLLPHILPTYSASSFANQGMRSDMSITYPQCTCFQTCGAALNGEVGLPNAIQPPIETTCRKLREIFRASYKYGESAKTRASQKSWNDSSGIFSDWHAGSNVHGAPSPGCATHVDSTQCPVLQQSPYFPPSSASCPLKAHGCQNYLSKLWDSWQEDAQRSWPCHYEHLAYSSRLSSVTPLHSNNGFPEAAHEVLRSSLPLVVAL